MAKICSSIWKFVKSHIWLSSIVALIVVIVGLIVLNHKGTTYQFVTATKGSIIQSVDLTGNTTPTESVSLAFGSSGIISNVYSDLGKQVYSGQVLAELDMSDLQAQLRQAQADVATEQAKLAGLQAGAQPEDIAASQASVDKAKQDLANMYASIMDTSSDSYAKANDAVRTQLSGFFTNSETQSPLLTYATPNSQAQANAQNERAVATTDLNKWQTALGGANQSNDQLTAFLQTEVAYLSDIKQLLNSVSQTLNGAATPAAYQTNVTTALNETNTATDNLNTMSQNISSQNLTVAELQAELALKQAGSTPSDISAQEAQVGEAQASVASAQAKLQNAEIIAPISGVVTQFDAKVGELASPSTPLVSIMSSGGYEVDAGVSEIDIGKVSIGDKVSMTLDAFPNETFTGSVFYIAPAETNTGGVISYQIKISFDKADPRLKSGLTANISIQTKEDDNVLTLPEYAILQNDQGTFVETLVNKKIVQNPVTLGIQDENGNVEVLSGVTEGEQVLNIGLKS